MEKIIRGLQRQIPDATDWESEEEQRFIRFFEIVQEAAASLSKVFFFDSIEGHSANFDDPIDYEDITGWLVPFKKAEEFEKEWEQNEPSNQWNDFYYDADWEKTHGKIKIIFTKLNVI